MLSSMKSRIIALAVVAVVAVIGVVGYFYLFADEADRLEIQQIDAASPSAAGTTAAAAASSPGATTAAATATQAASGSTGNANAFKVDTAKSRARLLVKEDFTGPGSHTAEIDSPAVTGEFTLTSNGLDTSKPAVFTVDTTQFKSADSLPAGVPFPTSRRDNVVARTLDSGAFPKATFTVTSVSGFPATIPSSGEGAAFKMTGMLEIKGTKKEVTMDARLLRSGNTISGLATVTIKFADFGMSPPSVPNFVTVADSVTIDLQLVATSG